MQKLKIGATYEWEETWHDEPKVYTVKILREAPNGHDPEKKYLVEYIDYEDPENNQFIIGENQIGVDFIPRKELV